MRHYNRRNRPYIGQLEQSQLFSQCSRRELYAIASFCTPVNVKAGRVLTRQDEPGVECFVVLKGHAVVERNGTMIGTIGDDSIIGEIALLRHVPRTATVTAASDMTLLVMSKAEVGGMRALGIANAVWDHAEQLAERRLAIVEQTPAVAERATPTTTPAGRQRQLVEH